MSIATLGIVLSRQVRGEFDEKIHFYTKDLGKILVYSFGSQSSRSHRGQVLAELGWLDLKLEKRGQHYRLLEVSSHHVSDYQRSKEYFLDWSEFLKILSIKLPSTSPTPQLFSLLQFLSGPEPALWGQHFRKFTWYFSALIEWGSFPNFQYCHHCQEYCSNIYYFSPPGEIVGSVCISKIKNASRQSWLTETLGLEDVCFLYYGQKNYAPRADFFHKLFALAGRLSQELSIEDYSIKDEERLLNNPKLSIHWGPILALLETCLRY